MILHATWCGQKKKKKKDLEVILTLLCSLKLFTTAKMWKQPKCPLTDGWINKMWSMHAMEYDSAIKRAEALTRATIWMNLENIMSCERSQTQKDKNCMILFT